MAIAAGVLLIAASVARSVANAEPTFYVGQFCQEDDHTRLVEMAAGRATRTIVPCTPFVDGNTGFDVAVSSDRRKIAVAIHQSGPSFDLNLCSRQPLACRDVDTKLFATDPHALAFARADQRLVMAVLDRQSKQRLWEVDHLTGRVVRNMRTPAGWSVIAIARDGRLLFGKADISDRRLYVGTLLGPKRRVRARLSGEVAAFDGDRVLLRLYERAACRWVELETGASKALACPADIVGATLP